MADNSMSQYIPSSLFFKSKVVEENPDMTFREAMARFLGVEPDEITKIRRTPNAKGWDIFIQGLYQPSLEEEDYQWDLNEEEEESEWMTPEEMGIAQKMDWSDEDGNEISNEQKPAYFRSRDDMYEVDEDTGLVRLLPEEDWFPTDDNQEDWEREGYRGEIAWQNRWRDYTEPEEEMDDDEEDYRRDPYSPWND